ncbi:pyridoxamine 5'-phosphate oxidase family protein [Streptomyces justiciae]|uniref:pyridoxamine 5'-phosphate oxidase family protein n=1 Tax=Streptomyces justiciae TaxID=2780140 RepID=UPI002117E046|nr:pyridoxamine 5'-phosphate oxidase family protein [Streptomyces justiciae]MCW8383880.1 pyridoxamine 5'-phosphate oxidase family protein [Streptomyces justiciae]
MLLDAAVAETVDAYRTCEFVTLARDGTPVAWPTAALRRDDGTFLITTSLAFAQKALNVRRDGRVALLFSDPTGSGLDAAEQVFVSGTAVCPEEIVTSPAGDEAYWSMLFDRQPDSRRYVDLPARWLMDWYYLRLLITVTPTGITTRPSLSVRSGDPNVAADAGSSVPGADILARFSTAVLGARDASGAPLLMRTPVQATPEGFLVETTADCEVVAGPASLLVHRHDDRLAGLYNALVRGELRRSGDGWLLVPHRVVEPSGDGGARTLRNARRATNTYLRKRNLDRPRVDWPALKTLATASASRAGGA